MRQLFAILPPPNDRDHAHEEDHGSCRPARATFWLAAAILLVPASSALTQETKQELIVYTALRPANWDLYLFESPGGTPKRLTRDRDLDYNATFSPDGRWVVFCSERLSTPDLFLLDLENPGPPLPLITGPAMEDAPAISPDGRLLAFVSSRAGNADVFVVPFHPENTDAKQQTATGVTPVPHAENLTRHTAGDFNPAFSPDGEWIAFSSGRDDPDGSEIYVMRTNGSDVRRLTERPGWDGSPCWSADGKAIFFYGDEDDGLHLARVSIDGGEPMPITSKDGTAVSPALLPNGRIGFASRRDDRWGIYSVAEDGSDERIESDSARDYWSPTVDPNTGRMICHGLTADGNSPVFQSGTPGPFLVNNRAAVPLPDRTLQVFAVRGYFPSVSPDGVHVVSDEGFERVVTSRLDGSELRVVFEPSGQRTWRPSWSPAGDWIACTAGPTFAAPGERADIWKFPPDGSDAVNLTAESEANDAFPDFSPDGKQLVLRSGRTGNHELFLMNADGTGVVQLTDNPAVDTMPAFSPTGDRIAFTTDRDGDYEIYTLALKDSQPTGPPTRVTHSPGRDTHPKFSPDGKWLVFASQRGGLNDETPLIPVFNPQPYGDIYAVHLEDGSVVRLTHNKWEDGTPTWGKSAQ